MSLRHSRLLRILSITLRGRSPANQRAYHWRGGEYLIDDLRRESVRAWPNGSIDMRNVYTGWDRRWKAFNGLYRKFTRRERSKMGAHLRRNWRLAQALASRSGLSRSPGYDLSDMTEFISTGRRR